MSKMAKITPPIFRKTLAFALSVAIALPLFTTGGVTNENAVYAADEKFTYGDVNNDGIINILDMISLKSYLVENNASNFSVKAADVDDDGTISSKDVVEVSMYLLDQVETFSYERNIDTDKDGLCDYIEKEFLQTDPAKADTDGDGLSDYDEVYLCDTDPLTVDTGKTGVKDSAKDSDNDKLTNAEEIKLGTSPTISDTDSDGLNDYDEVKKYKTDPLKSDTDGDMISDSAELKLGLDPIKGMTDGKTSDTDRVFEQKIASDSNILSAVNTEENPFLFSADAKCSGYIEESAYACVSGYSNYLSSDVILGNIVDFSYDDAFSIEELSLSFKLDDSYTAEDYMIFNYSEDINMLFPVETEYNGNVLSATATNGGTYCVVDLDKWTDSLSDADITQPSSTPAPPSYGFVGSSETKSYSDLEIYFMLFVKSGYTDCTRQSVAKASRSIIDYCNQNNKNIKIYFVSYVGNTVVSKDTGKNYVSNSSTDAEINDMLGRSGTVPISYDSSSNKNALTYIIKKELLGITGENANSRKYCFMIDGNTEPKCDSYIQAVEDMKLNGTTFDIICNDYNGNIAFYNSLSSNGSHYKLVTDISDIIVSEVFSDEDRILSYNINTGIGNEIPYDLSIITPQWKEVFEKYPDELSLEDILDMNFPDIDEDGIPDCLEINMEYINFDKNKNIILPSYSDLAKEKDEKGFLSFIKNLFKKQQDKDISNIKVLPVLSDPSKVDSDGDGYLDGTDVYQDGKVLPKDPRPLKYEIIPYLEDLCKLAEDYERYYDIGSYELSQKLVMDYIRAGKYNDQAYYGLSLWPIAAGNIDKDFIRYVNHENPDIQNYLYAKDEDDEKYIKDPSTGELIDFTHLAATFSAILYDSSEFKVWLGYAATAIIPYDKSVPNYSEEEINNLSGWAGDLQSMIQQDLLIYYDEPYGDEWQGDHYFDIEALKKHSEDYYSTLVFQLLENKKQYDNDESTHILLDGKRIRNAYFDISDQLSDIDAVNIFVNFFSSKKLNINDSFTKYYSSFCDNRYNVFIDNIFSMDEEYSKSVNYIDVQKSLKNGSISNDEYKLKIGNMFTEYIYNYTREYHSSGRKWTLYYSAPVIDEVAKGAAKGFSEYIISKWS